MFIALCTTGREGVGYREPQAYHAKQLAPGTPTAWSLLSKKGLGLDKKSSFTLLAIFQKISYMRAKKNIYSIWRAQEWNYLKNCKVKVVQIFCYF